MNVKSISFQANSIKNIDVIQKEKYKIKNEINSVLNSFSCFYVGMENKSFSSKISFFIKKIFNLKTDLTFLLDKHQHVKVNDLFTLFAGGEKIKYKNCRLINSDFISFKRASLDSFFLSLNTAIKNDCHDNAKKLIQNYLYEKSKTKGDFITIMSISLDVINNYQREKFEQLSRHSSECASMLNYINFNYRQYIDTAIDYACKELDGKKYKKIDNSIMYLVNTMHDIYSMEMEKNFIINITKCFIDKAVKYNVGNYNNSSFRKYILNLLTNKLKNNECVNKFIDNMLNSGLLEYDNIVKEEEKTAGDECFISEYNRKMKNLFSKNKNSDEMKNNIANIIRDNYEVILNKMKNNSNYLENERVLLDVIDYLKSDNDWSFNFV
ncbi:MULTISPECIES: hypothetical protein [Proteus]|uniref:hypothetical protein n=1 Tax=Proteus TaxID=583 RepID=UPI000505AF6B|nr:MULTISPECIES: hypothetical protein [Proteus]AYY81880.1 hypothetical protein EGX81_13790 [Proteus vulgaris]KGA57357.1 hypothetical protein DR95_2432 [Proteus vulgaris]MBW3473038.1 hypothetical protein [Proteus vulgaris]MDM3560967.1 hypothetical protein [Proteus vulgaris]NBN44745.1 hypothetical protein [Proteus sp. G2626]